MTAQIPGIDPKAEDEEEIACSGIDSLLHGASFLLAPRTPRPIITHSCCCAQPGFAQGSSALCLRLALRDTEASWFRVSGRGPSTSLLPTPCAPSALPSSVNSPASADPAGRLPCEPARHGMSRALPPPVCSLACLGAARRVLPVLADKCVPGNTAPRRGSEVPILTA